jgi:hypothetical protein
MFKRSWKTDAELVTQQLSFTNLDPKIIDDSNKYIKYLNACFSFIQIHVWLWTVIDLELRPSKNFFFQKC